MTDVWTSRWDERYREAEFAYGEEPNEFLKEQLEKLEAGSILFPAEGEGRNAVFAARLGWDVSAFDISSEGLKKAEILAEKNHVTIDYRVGELQNLGYSDDQFDAIALIYAHFPAEIKSQMHRQLNRYLRPGGTFIFEAFSKNHLEYLAKDPTMGGPKDIGSLFSVEEIKADFPNYEVLELTEMEIDLNEGLYHVGKGSVIRFVGIRK
ncbi:MAG: class I SAM-dependent methyltransferase [Pyrinomonadaceae bacterium]